MRNFILRVFVIIWTFVFYEVFTFYFVPSLSSIKHGTFSGQFIIEAFIVYCVASVICWKLKIDVTND